MRRHSTRATVFATAGGLLVAGLVARAQNLTVTGTTTTGANPVAITSGWTAFPDSATNRAEISNDTGTYRALMIAGNRSGGGGRRVSIYDQLDVFGPLTATGAINAPGLIVGGGSSSNWSHVNAPGLQTSDYIYTYGRMCAGNQMGNCTGVGGVTVGTPPAGSTPSTLVSAGTSYFNAGNVGIGTSTPVNKLTINGGKIGISSSQGAFGVMQLANPAAGEASIGFFSSLSAFGAAPTAATKWLMGTGGYGLSPNTFFIGHSSDGTGGLKMVITPEGRVSIGAPVAAAPAYTLQVNGSVAGTSWNQLSSKEFKEDIRYLGADEYARILEETLGLRLARYRYKKEHGGDGTTTLGFIAEEMPKQVLAKDGKAVNLYELVGYSIGAIKAMKGDNDLLESKVQRQAEQLRAQEDRLQTQEALTRRLLAQVQQLEAARDSRTAR